MTHEDLVLKFYTGMKVVGGTTGEDFAHARNADWVVIRDAIGSEAAFAGWLTKNIDWDKYQPVTLPVPDALFENRESPEDHLFRTADAVADVTIYHKDEE